MSLFADFRLDAFLNDLIHFLVENSFSIKLVFFVLSHESIKYIYPHKLHNIVDYGMLVNLYGIKKITANWWC